MSTPPMQKPMPSALPSFTPQAAKPAMPSMNSSGFRNPQEATIALIIIGIGVALLLFTLLSM